MYIEFSPNTAPTVQSEHHGSVLKDVTADGEWHFYQWNLDDFSGSADGWTSVANIIGNAGSATIEDGFHTIDSVIFRHADVGTLPIVDNVRKTTLFMDYVVKSSTGTITLPEPPVSGGVGADFNGDATLGPPEVDVDGKDFLIWQAGYGETLQTNNSKGDANADGVVDDLDFRDPAQVSDKNWTSQFGGQPIPASLAAAGAIPEPAGAALALVALAALAKACRPRT